MEVLTHRICGKCGDEKPIEAFPFHPSSAGGRERRCADCKKAYLKEYHSKNKKLQAEKARAYRQTEQGKRAKRASSERCIEQKRQHDREYYTINRDGILSHRRKEIATNPAKKARKQMWEQNYRAAKAAGGSYTLQEWKELCDATGNVCLCCGTAENISVDHIVPVSKGGSNLISNLQPLCRPCNSSKQAKTIDYRPPHLRR